jgi:zinc protease
MLVITGKVEPEAAVALAQSYFGTLPARPPPARVALPPLSGTRSVILQVSANAAREQVRVSWITPRHGAPGDVELDLAAAVLQSRLLRSVGGTGHRAVAVGSSQHSMALASVFEIRATVAEGHTNAEVFDGIEAAVAQLAVDIPPEELRAAQRGLYTTRLFRLDSSLGWASELAWALSVAPAPPTFDGQLGVYEALTPASVLDAVRRYLRGKPRVVTLIERDTTQPWFGTLRVRTEGAP